MRLIQVFEPPMCCSTGVCGPEVDPVLVQFGADLDALRESGVKVERFNLSQNPNQFATTPAVLALLREKGADSLPAILADGHLVLNGSYPDAAKLRAIVDALPQHAAASPSSIERVRAALSSGRSVLLCHANGNGAEFIEPFRSVATNPAFADSVVLVELAGETDDEGAIAQEVGFPADESAAVLIAPPGYMIAQWRGSADADEVMIRVLQASQPSSCCSPSGGGGGCCS